MKEILLLVAGVALGALGIYTVFCQKPTPPHVVDATVIDEKLREIGKLTFAQKPQAATATVKIPKEFRVFGRVVARDGVTIEVHWKGIHLYAVDLSAQKPEVENGEKALRVKMPPYAHWVSYVEPGSLDFKTTDGSWFISEDDRYRIAVEQVQAQNTQDGIAYMKRGREELEQACIKAVTGVVYPLVKTSKPIEVVCPAA